MRYLLILFTVLPSFAQHLYVNFEGVAAGTPASLSIMGTISKTNGNAVTFSYVGSSTGISVENQTSFPGLLRPVTVNGISYTNHSPTKALYVRPDEAGDGTLQKFMWTYAASRKVSCGFSITMTNFGSAVTDYYNCGGYETGGNYGVISMVADGSVPYIQAETVAGTGADVLIGGNGTSALTIWVTTLWDSANSKYICAFYNQTNMALMGFSTMATTLNATVNTMGFGSTGAHHFTPGENFWLNNLILYTNGSVWPVWPGNNLQVPTNFTPAAVTAAIAAASDGDTIILPATNATWTTGVTLNKDRVVMSGIAGFPGSKITKGTNSTVITADGSITAFTVTGSLNTISNMQVKGDLTTDEATFFDNTGAYNRYAYLLLREANIGLYAKQAGLMDNCVNVDHNFMSRNIWGNSYYDSLYPLAWDSTNYFVYEDSKFYWTSGKNTIGSGRMMSSQQGDAWVVRRCYFELNNASTDPAPMFDFHGDSPGLGRPGIALQIYSNYFNFLAGSVDSQKFVDVRGTRSLIYSNKFVGASYPSDGNAGIHYREEDVGSSPNYIVNNSYVWENYHGASGTTAMPVVDDANITAGVDYFATALTPLVEIPYPHPLRNETAGSGPTPDLGFTPSPPRIRGIRLTR